MKTTIAALGGQRGGQRHQGKSQEQGNRPQLHGADFAVALVEPPHQSEPHQDTDHTKDREEVAIVSSVTPYTSLKYKASHR